MVPWLAWWIKVEQGWITGRAKVREPLVLPCLVWMSRVDMVIVHRVRGVPGDRNMKYFDVDGGRL